MGHEFDNYPQQTIRDIKDWDWFLEEPKYYSENDEMAERKDSRGKKKTKRKKKEEGNADQDWAGESDNEKGLIAKLIKSKRPKYATRSKDFKKSIKDSRSRKKLLQKEIVRGNKEEEDDDGNEDEEEEDEETLGGFIVNDEVLEENLADEEEEKEEEEEYYEIDDDSDSEDEQINEENIED